MEVDIKTAKPGILYRVFVDKVDKIDFVRYFERTIDELYCGYGSDACDYREVNIGCYEYRQHSNHPHWNLGLKETECDYREHFFENLEDAKQFVIEHYYENKIQEYKKKIEKVENEIKEFTSKTVENKLWLL